MTGTWALELVVEVAPLGLREYSERFRTCANDIVRYPANPMSDRTTILIHCSTLEAAEIRYRAKLDRRNVSSYILNILMRSVDFEERLPLNFPDFTL